MSVGLPHTHLNFPAVVDIPNTARSLNFSNNATLSAHVRTQNVWVHELKKTDCIPGIKKDYSLNASEATTNGSS